MITTGKVLYRELTLDGKMFVTFKLNDSIKVMDEFASLEECDNLQIEVKKYRKRRSLTANAYFWQLLDKMSKRLGTDKDTMYLLQLSKYGVFVDLSIKTEALPILKEHFRYVELFDDGYDDVTTVRCYYGSSGYNSKEMYDLITGTVRDAKEIGGIETLTPSEIDAMVSAWKGAGYGKD